jgi:hypothetical protein
MDKAQNNELDEQLKQLAISVQQHPPLTQGRQLALRKLRWSENFFKKFSFKLQDDAN